MAAPAIGPTLSGYIVDYVVGVFYFSKHSCRYTCSSTLCSNSKETPKKEGLTFDLSGSVLSITFFGTLLLALSKGQSEGLGLLLYYELVLCCSICFALLLWVETGKEQPILEVRFFKNPVFAFSTFASGLVDMGLYGGVFLTPLYLQTVQGLSPIQTGLVMMPQSMLWH